MPIFDYVPHPHVERRKLAGPPKVVDSVATVHGQSWLGRFNARVGLKITLIVGTMWCAYLFTLLALISLPSAIKSGNAIIIVGQTVQAAAADRRAEATYNDAAAVLEEAKQIQAHLAAQDEAISTMLAHIERLAAAAGQS